MATMTELGLLPAMALAAIAPLLLTWGGSLLGLRLFPNFRSREQKAGEYRRDAVPAAVAGSSRLPCVVGPAMLLGLTVSLVAAMAWLPAERARFAYMLALCWAEWLLGFLDDLRKSRGMGLGERVRLLVHLAIAVAAAVAFVRLGFAGAVGVWQQVGSAVVVVVALLYVVLAAGFSDGVDGLTSGLTALTCLGLAILGEIWADQALGVAAGAASGMAVGALVVNLPSDWTRTGTRRRRARGYIGDSGALLGGAAVVGIALTAGAVALLPLLAAGFLLEGGSVFLQTGLLTPLFRRGLRLRRFAGATTFVPHTEFPLPFLATPLHHHLNLIGLRPLQVVAWFWLLQVTATVLALGAAIVVAPVVSAACWAAGLLLLILASATLAATKGLFLDLADKPGDASELVIRRGLPFQLWGRRAYRDVERLPGVAAPPCRSGSLGRPLPRYDALWQAATIAEQAGQAERAAALLRRLPAASLLLRPEAALLVARQAMAAGNLPALAEDWRRALRPVYQEGRLDSVLEYLGSLARAQGDCTLAVALAGQVGAPTPSTAQPRRWR
jgi:UDP-N-acetylmuramyl pentapeptide phosphotransferase/UDP-N-acetylglucosamine-1-phosphate transferase